VSIAILFVLVLLALLGLSLFVVLGAGALIASWLAGIDFATLIVELNRLASSPNLSAIPLFTFAGVVLAAGGAPQRMIRLFNALFGWLPGGLALVVVTSCAFFTAFSGASGVTILALGGLLYPLLIQTGYSRRFSLGLLTSSGSIGLMFPPSLPILLYAIVAQINVDQLFMAGVIPGLLLLTLFAAYSLKWGGQSTTARVPFSRDALLTALRAGVWDVLLPVAITIGIFGGWVTVSESATCAAAYVLLLESVIHRNLNLRKQFVTLARDSAVLVGSILIILAMAMGLTNLLIDAQLPMKMLALLEDSVHSPLSFLLLLNVLLLFVGAMMDIFSAIVVVVPLILPLALRYGIDPLHLGVIFLANLEIGYITPPVGINLFLASQRFNKPVLEIFRSTMPFLLLMLFWLMLVTYVPMLSLWWR
jgi:tripartite ATP-independent transporter DctM subunit